jgi:hypothetical protein
LKTESTNNSQIKNIIVISNEPWGDIWYSKHNYAFELSRNSNVIFVDPPQRWKFKNLFKKIELHRIGENLFRLTYPNTLPSLNSFFFKLNNFIVSYRLRTFLRKEKFKDYIFWTFDPFRLYSPKLLGARKSIFHIVDNYQFSHYGEIELCTNIDYLICVSDTIAKNYYSFNKKLLVVPHALSSDEFISDKKPMDIPDKPFALYIGNIDKRLDYEQLENIIQLIPSLKFVFIGKLHFSSGNMSADRIFTQKKYENVYYLGVKNFKELKNYIKYSEICLAIMDEKFPGNRIAHHKIFQYLALGKPVFCSVFSDYFPIKSYLYMEDHTDNMVMQIRNFLENGEKPDLCQIRIAIAKEHLINNAIVKIEQFINEQ